MIITLKKGIDKNKIQELGAATQSIVLFANAKRADMLITFSSIKNLPEIVEPYTDSFVVCDTDMQLSSKTFMTTTREMNLGGVTIGGHSGNCIVITGPCSVESEEQIELSAQLCKSLDVKVLRAGCYKPRTSPYSFQGMGLDGLKLLDKMRTKYGLKIITEVRDSTHIDEVIEWSDIIQIGAKSMYDHGILRRCGKAGKPVLLKRGFGTTLQEFVQASEFILSGGNDDVILCERGIRTFETKTRFTYDLCGVEWLKEYTNLPVILDPSHAMGYAYGVPNLARASVALGCDGLLIESHPNPKVAKSDASQQLTHEQMTELHSSLKKVTQAIDRQIV